MRRAFLVAFLVAFLAAAARLGAQAPNNDWHSIETTHFVVTFTPSTEGLARRIAADAERAYAQLSQTLHPPRGKIDVVISDDVDASNGSATPYPTNRIVVYANPPVSESALRYNNDWGQLVITHELTHIFHLDRTRGIWSLGQHIFGRAAALFPNYYSPSWVTEGLAVYEESKLTGAGRIEGSEHRMIARSAAIEHRFPSLGALSLSYGRFPFGEQAYGYGSLFMDYLARAHGDTAVRTFVDKSATHLIPYLLDGPAKQAFGVSFETAWRQFQDSIGRTLPANVGDPMGGWKPLTRDGVFVSDPRWLGDSSLVYTGTPGKQSFGAYRVDVNGRRDRIGRRNSFSPNIQLGPNRYLFAQSDFVSPYQIRSDLWIQDGKREIQLTHGARLTLPDARADGEIVAQQIIPGATRIARVSADGKRITPITNGSYDEQWTEPRWSHKGDRIAAVRWRRGNLSQIVVIDTTGRELAVLASKHSIQATPSWSFDDSGVYYSSDYTGSAQIYFTKVGGPSYRLSDAATGLFEPQASPTNDRLASVLFRADGYHLGVSPCCDMSRLETAPVVLAGSPSEQSVAPVVVDSSPVKKFNPWRTFLPRYWIPTFDQTGVRGGDMLGGTTSGFDIVGRHTMTANIAFPLSGVGGVVGGASYQYAGFGVPVIQVDGSQDWESLGVAFNRDAQRTRIGEVFRRTRSADALVTWIRAGARSSASFTGGFGIEHRTHFLDADVPLTSLDTTGGLGAPTYPSAIVAAGYNNTQRPPFSISPEDGVSLNVTVRDRFNSGSNGRGGASYSAVSSAAIYKSLDLPGFAHHVLALRGSAGFADDNAAGYFIVGGTTGSTYQIIPGYTIGEGRRTFPVRGFLPGTLAGTRAFTGSAEYRIPLLLVGDAPWALPFFLDRSSLTLFADYGIAWCPNIAAGREVCNNPNPVYTQKLDIASAGAELNINLGVLSWDSPFRFRLGAAVPTQNARFFGRPGAELYLVTGISF